LFDTKTSVWRAEDGVGGHLVLDFMNTCGSAGKERDAERLVNWSDAIEWAMAYEVLDPAETRLVEKARLRERHRPSDRLKDLIEFREAMHAVFSAMAGGVPPPETARLQVEGYIVDAMRHSMLCVNGQAPARWTVLAKRAGSATLRHRLAIAASELLSQPVVVNVRECGACSWLFLDLSRSKSRRWCSMATCGNRAKAHRHYHSVNQ
jgi:predicted RNA-binding Zn ribbon-like protein